MPLIPRTPTAPFPAGGGFGFTDPRTLMPFDGMMGNAETTAQAIIKHRRGNPNKYDPTEAGLFDLDSVVQEIYAQKQKTHPHLFIGGPELAAGVPPQAASVCTCGSTEFEPIYCATCGSGKSVVVGQRCKKCGGQK